MISCGSRVPTITSCPKPASRVAIVLPTIPVPRIPNLIRISFQCSFPEDIFGDGNGSTPHHRTHASYLSGLRLSIPEIVSQNRSRAVRANLNQCHEELRYCVRHSDPDLHSGLVRWRDKSTGALSELVRKKYPYGGEIGTEIPLSEQYDRMVGPKDMVGDPEKDLGAKWFQSSL